MGEAKRKRQRAPKAPLTDMMQSSNRDSVLSMGHRLVTAAQALVLAEQVVEKAELRIMGSETLRKIIRAELEKVLAERAAAEVPHG